MLVATGVDELEETITATEAAEEFGVDVRTICAWVQRSYLQVAGIDTRNGRPVKVYKRGDVGLAELTTRRRALNRRAIFAARASA